MLYMYIVYNIHYNIPSQYGNLIHSCKIPIEIVKLCIHSSYPIIYLPDADGICNRVWPFGAHIETVLLYYDNTSHRRTVCIIIMHLLSLLTINISIKL